MKKLFLILSLLSLNLYAQDYLGTATKDAPALKDRFPDLKFEDYNSPVYQGKIAKKVDYGKEDREDNLRLAESLEYALEEAQKDPKPNFAGKYLIVPTGCGTMCVFYSLLDLETGNFSTMPSPMAYYINKKGNPVNYDKDEEVADIAGGDLLHFPNSRLIFMDGSIELNEKDAYGSFAYEFKDGEFKLLKHSPVVKWGEEQE